MIVRGLYWLEALNIDQNILSLILINLKYITHATDRKNLSWIQVNLIVERNTWISLSLVAIIYIGFSFKGMQILSMFLRNAQPAKICVH